MRWKNSFTNVVDKDSNQGAQMKEHVKKQAPLRGHQPEEVLEQRQVAGTGDGQKLRHALNQPQENG